MRSSLHVAAAIASLSVASLTADAGTILVRDNFQSDTAGTGAVSTDLDPLIGAGDIGGVWQITENPALAVQVLNDTVPGNGIAGLDNYIRVYKGGSNTTRGAPYARGWIAADTLDRVLQLDMRVYQPVGSGMSVFFGSALPNTNVNSGVNTFANASPVQVSMGADLPDDVWNTVRIIANLSSTDTQEGLLPQTYSLSINGGIPTTSSFAVTANQVPAILVGLSETVETFNYIDDVTIQIVPEPSTLALLAVGLLCCVARGRK